MKKLGLLALTGSFLLGLGPSSLYAQTPPPRQPFSQSLEATFNQNPQPDFIFFRQVIDEIVIRDIVQAHIEETSPESKYIGDVQRNLRQRDNTKLNNHIEKHIGTYYSDEIQKNLSTNPNPTPAVEYFALPHRLCLDLALKYVNKKPSDQDIQEVGRKIINIQNWISRYSNDSPVNHLDQNVYTATQQWARLRTYEFQKLLSASHKSPITIPAANIAKDQKKAYVAWLYPTAFKDQDTGRETYSQHIQEEDDADEQIRQALISTIRAGPIIRTKTIDEINYIRDKTQQMKSKVFQTYFRSNSG